MTVLARPCWVDSVSAPSIEPTPLPQRADVVVIGAGFTGLCAARALAKRGLDVVVLEAHTVGWGASSRNGGMVNTGLKIGGAGLIERFGRDLARALFKASVDSVSHVADLVSSERIDCDFHRSGHLALASKLAHFESMQRAAETLAREFDHTPRPVSKADLRAEIGSDLYFGGVVDEVSGGINPAKYVAGLGRIAREAGAKIHERTTVQSLQRIGIGWRVATSRGALEATEVLVATSGYTSEVTRALKRKLLPIGSYIIATEILPESLCKEISPRERMMYDSRHFLSYFRLTPDRRFLMGGRARFVPETPTTIEESVPILRQEMLAIYPQLRDVRIEYAWGGTLDFPFDKLPHSGRIDGYHFAIGYAGHGVALASWLGTRVGEKLGTTGLDDIPFTRVPFPGAPLGMHWGKPGLLRLAAAWYKFLDRVS